MVLWSSAANQGTDEVYAADKDEAEESAEQYGQEAEEQVRDVGGHLVLLRDGLVHVAQQHRGLDSCSRHSFYGTYPLLPF